MTAPAPYQTFSQMQKQGIARPAPYFGQPVSQQKPVKRPVDPAPTPYQAPAPQAPQTGTQAAPAPIPRPPASPPVATIPTPQPRTDDSTSTYGTVPPPTPFGTDKVLPPGFTIPTPGTRTDTGGSGTPQGLNVQQLLQSLLGAPNRFSSDTAMSTFDRLSGRLDEDFGLAERRLNESLTSRGLGDSSIYGDKFSDFNTERMRAKSDLANQVNEQAAAQDWQDRLSALGAFEQAQGGQFNRDFQTAQLNDTREARQLALLIQLLLGGGA